MIKKLGIFINTHQNPGFRHGGAMEKHMFEYLKNIVIGGYEKFNSGISDNYDIIVGDTGSTNKEYIDYIEQKTKDNKNVKLIHVPNHCGFAATMKYVMHENTELKNLYEYFFFHVDDGVEPINDNWGSDLIEQYHSIENPGMMNRFVDKIKLGPTGLVDHRNCCPHIAQIWGIEKVTIVPHTHADWWFMDKDTLNKISDVWYDPIRSVNAMEYQKHWENEDFCKLARLGDGRRTLDNIHIGRETDMALRLNFINKNMHSYLGNKIYTDQLHHRV